MSSVPTAASVRVRVQRAGVVSSQPVRARVSRTGTRTSRAITSGELGGRAGALRRAPGAAARGRDAEPDYCSKSFSDHRETKRVYCVSPRREGG